MSRQQVLLVDDSDWIHKLIHARLSDLGVDLSCVSTGREGLELAREGKPQPDLVLLDVELPGLTGFEVCRRLKDDPKTRDIPVIFLTGSDASDAKVLGFDLGAVDYVTKPFDPAELRARVRAALKSKKLLDLLTEQAEIDGLTGLHNRRYFDHHLEQAVKTAQRHDRPLSLLITDIDRFKQVNDRFGHPKGDQVVRAFADALSHACRASDAPCRYGGDEFIVVLPETDAGQLTRFATRLIETVRRDPDLAHAVPVAVTTSIGGASCEVPAHCVATDLLRRADEALYRSKQAGRNRYTLDDGTAPAPGSGPEGTNVATAIEAA